MSEVAQDFAHSTVPASSRKGFFPILVVMVGLTFFSASMWAGGTLGQGLTFSEFLLTVMAGNLLLGIYTSALAYIGSKTGLSTHLLTQYVFGRQGAKFTSLLLSLTQIGWFGVGVAMFALPVNRATGIDVTTLVMVVWFINDGDRLLWFQGFNHSQLCGSTCYYCAGWFFRQPGHGRRRRPARGCSRLHRSMALATLRPSVSV